MEPVVRRYGLKPERTVCPSGHVGFFASAAKLPAKVDLRPGMPPVWDQGQLGACTGFAVSAAFSYAAKNQMTPSQLFVYYNERSIDGDVQEDAGSTLSTGIRALRQFGVCPLPEWPYDVAKFAVKPDPKCYEEALKHEVIGASQLQATVTAIKGGLAKGFPVVLGIQVYQSFESDGVARTGVIPEPNKSKEQCLGGHAICLAGYDDAKKAFILRNSWGSGWGLACPTATSPTSTSPRTRGSSPRSRPPPRQ